MKLLQYLLVAPAALTCLIAPLSAKAADLNIDSVSDYSATLDLEQAKQLLQQVTSVNQFNDVYPTDWAYQALVKLVKTYGCVAGYPNGSFRGLYPDHPVRSSGTAVLLPRPCHGDDRRSGAAAEGI